MIIFRGEEVGEGHVLDGGVLILTTSGSIFRTPWRCHWLAPDLSRAGHPGSKGPRVYGRDAWIFRSGAVRNLQCMQTTIPTITTITTSRRLHFPLGRRPLPCAPVLPPLPR